ncbi:MAG TPA: hypothetical protein VIK53_16255 [Verrucomicrobiae bacterium]
MPKPRLATAPKDWKPFRLADGTKRLLPDWEDKPLVFAFDPEAALREVLKVKPPRDWRKVIKTGRKNRR